MQSPRGRTVGPPQQKVKVDARDAKPDALDFTCRGVQCFIVELRCERQRSRRKGDVQSPSFGPRLASQQTQQGVRNSRAVAFSRREAAVKLQKPSFDQIAVDLRQRASSCRTLVDAVD